MLAKEETKSILLRTFVANGRVLFADVSFAQRWARHLTCDRRIMALCSQACSSGICKTRWDASHSETWSTCSLPWRINNHWPVLDMSSSGRLTRGMPTSKGQTRWTPTVFIVTQDTSPSWDANPLDRLARQDGLMNLARCFEGNGTLRVLSGWRLFVLSGSSDC